MPKTHVALLIVLVILFSLMTRQPAEAALPVLTEEDVERFVRTFPEMYREYRLLGLQVDPETGEVRGVEKVSEDRQVDDILKDNGWDVFFWPKLQAITRAYSLVKHQQFEVEHRANLEQFIEGLKNSKWTTPEQRVELETAYAQAERDYEATTQRLEREVHPRDVELVRKSTGELDSVMGEIAEFEWRRATGGDVRADAHQGSASASDPVRPRLRAADLPPAPTDYSNIDTVTTQAHVAQIEGSTGSPRGQAKRVTVVRPSGGRIDWSPHGDIIAIDRKGADGYYDIYLMSADGRREQCLTCDSGGALSRGHHGQPAWHPSGAFLVFQSQKKGHVGGWGRDLAATPGFGQHSDLWLLDLRTTRFHQLTHTADKGTSGVLHPHFSNDGSMLTWTDLYEKTGVLGTGAGNWKLKVANFSFSEGKPQLKKTRSFEPIGPTFYENHGTSPDDKKLIFTASIEGDYDWFKSTRICTLDLETQEFKVLTDVQSWNEHAQYLPDGSRIVWMSGAENTKRGTDYWSMNPDGSDRRRLTDFNNPDLPSYQRAAIVASDVSISPDGTRMAAWLAVDLIKQDGPLAIIELEPATGDGPPPADIEPSEGHALSEPITMNSGVYNPWTDRCSDSKAPVRRKMYVRQPAAPGKYPVFVFFIGTLRSPHNPTATRIADMAAARGYVAAVIDYDTIAGDFHAKAVCDSIEAKAGCSLPVNDPAASESALNLICNNRRIDGRGAGLKADCDLGILAAGFSQGATMAMLAANHDSRVRAVWGIGFHDQGLVDKEPMPCAHGRDGRPPGSRAIPTSKMRLLVGQDDIMLRRPLQPHLEATTGRDCKEETLQPCFAADGSGWAIVPNTECAGKCLHEYLDDEHFWDSSRWWGAHHNLEWLDGFVR